jgi:CHRD domain
MQPTRSHRLAIALAALTLGAVPAFAHIELRATLDGAQEVPPVTTAATGTATFLIDEEAATLTYEIQFTGLSGTVAAAHIHPGKRGVNGPPAITLNVATLANGTATGITPDQVAAMVSGGAYVNLHTAANIGGEIRGQLELASGSETCRCSEPGFKACVKNAIKGLSKDDKKSAGIKALKAAVKKASCGKTKGPKKAVGCCLAYTPQENIVIDRLCAAIPEAACAKRPGSLKTASCFDDTQCSPSGAFIDDPAF